MILGTKNLVPKLECGEVVKNIFLEKMSRHLMNFDNFQKIGIYCYQHKFSNK